MRRSSRSNSVGVNLKPLLVEVVQMSIRGVKLFSGLDFGTGVSKRHSRSWSVVSQITQHPGKIIAPLRICLAGKPPMSERERDLVLGRGCQRSRRGAGHEAPGANFRAQGIRHSGTGPKDSRTGPPAALEGHKSYELFALSGRPCCVTAAGQTASVGYKTTRNKSGRSKDRKSLTSQSVALLYLGWTLDLPQV